MPQVEAENSSQTLSPRALSAAEQEKVRQTLNSDRFVDSSPRQVYGTLLDEAEYLCSVSTMYRILRANDEVRERRHQKRHPAYSKPELVATAAQPGLDLGHYQTARAGDSRLLLSLHHSGHFQPLCRRLHDRRPRTSLS